MVQECRDDVRWIGWANFGRALGGLGSELEWWPIRMLPRYTPVDRSLCFSGGMSRMNTLINQLGIEGFFVNTVSAILQTLTRVTPRLLSDESIRTPS